MQADYITVVEDRPITSVKYCLPVLIFYFWPKLTHPAARFLCDERLVLGILIRFYRFKFRIQQVRLLSLHH